MNNAVIKLDSVTLAMKAKRILAGKGYRAIVEKSVDKLGGGCKSIIKVNGDKDTICRILESNGIACR